MKAKEYLQQLKQLDVHVDQKLRELSDLRMALTRVGTGDYSTERVQKSFSADAPFVATVERLVDLNAEIDREIDRFVDTRHEIINQIQGLKNPKHTAVLYKRYVEYKSFACICVEMHYSYDYIRHLHGRALWAFENKYLR